MKTIETKVADTLLDRPVSVRVGETEYNVAPPTVATIIAVSECVSRLPHTILNHDKILDECLSVAKDCRVLGEIAALLMLGAQGASKRRKLVSGRTYLWGLIDTRRYADVDPVEALTDEVLMQCSPRQLFDVITRILSTLELSDFFALTTFLSGVNLLRPTKVEN